MQLFLDSLYEKVLSMETVKAYIKSNPLIWMFAFFFAFALPLSYSEALIDPVLIPRLFVASVLLILIVLVSWRSLYKIELSKLSVTIVISFLIYIIIIFTSSFKSINAFESYFEGIRYLLFLVFFIYLTVSIKSNRDLDLLLKASCIGVLIVSQLGIFELLITDAQEYVLVRSTLANPNQLSSFLFLNFPFAIYGMYYFSKGWKILSSYVLASSLILISYSITRSVLLAIFAFSIITLPLYVIHNLRTNKKIISRNKLVPLSQVVGFFIAIALIISVFSPSPVKEQFTRDFRKDILGINDEITSPEAGNINTRIALWESTKKIFVNNPVIGIGAKNWRFEYPKYGLETFNFKTNQGTKHYQWAHNDFYGVMAETGLLGFLIYYGILVIALYFAFIVYLKQNNNRYQILSFLLIGCIVGLLVISVFSFPKERSAHNFILLLCIASIIYIYPKKKEKKWYQIKTINLVSAAICIVASYFIFQKFEGELQAKRILSARSNSKHSNVIRLVNKANKPFYQYDNFSTPLCWYKGEALFHLGKIEEALVEFQKAYELHPNHLYVLNNLAGSYETLGDHENSIKYYKKALEISPTFEEALVNLSIVYYNQNKMPEAFSTIKKCSTSCKQVNYKRALIAILHKKIDAYYSDKNYSQELIAEIKNNHQLLISIYEDAIKHNKSFSNEIAKIIQS